MRNLKFLFFIITFSFVSASSFAGDTEKFGKDLTLNEKTKVSTILEKPEDFLGKRVLVEGKILDVCEKAGCWMEIQGDQADQKIKVKVKDGEIVFPVEARGGLAVVEGEVYQIEMDQETAVEYFEHVAEEAGKEFDPSTVTGPITIYQLKGLGAEISMPVVQESKSLEIKSE